MLTGPIPTDLCPAHNEIARGWRDNHYNWRDPSEWPAGVFSPVPHSHPGQPHQP